MGSRHITETNKALTRLYMCFYVILNHVQKVQGQSVLLALPHTFFPPQPWLEWHQSHYQEPGFWIPPSRTRTSPPRLGKVVNVTLIVILTIL